MPPRRCSLRINWQEIQHPWKICSCGLQSLGLTLPSFYRQARATVQGEGRYFTLKNRYHRPGDMRRADCRRLPVFFIEAVPASYMYCRYRTPKDARLGSYVEHCPRQDAAFPPEFVIVVFLRKSHVAHASIQLLMQDEGIKLNGRQRYVTEGPLVYSWSWQIHEFSGAWLSTSLLIRLGESQLYASFLLICMRFTCMVSLRNWFLPTRIFPTLS